MAIEQLPYKAIDACAGEITERRWPRFVQNFLKENGEEQVAILKQAQSYLYLTRNRLYHYASDDNGAPHLQDSEGAVTTSLSSGPPSQILSLPSQLPSFLSS